MRQTAFRVWDGQQFKVQPRLAVSLLNCQPYICDMIAHSQVIQQWTGLYDFQHKEIFEGDVIRNQAGRLFIVEYVYRGFEYREIHIDSKTAKRTLAEFTCHSIGDEKLCQVVGTMFDFEYRL